MNIPDFEKKYEYENDFYLSSDSARIAKAISQYKLFEKTIHIVGDIIECGVFKGVSFSRFAMYRNICNIENKKLVGFDSFGAFPETAYEQDQKARDKFISEAGAQSISKAQLYDVLLNKKCDKNIELVEGDIVETVPRFVHDNPNTKISLLNLDVDIYEPTVAILEHLYTLVTPGGVIILDDYGTFHGETNAVNEYFMDKDVVIQKPIFKHSPYFIIKP